MAAIGAWLFAIALFALGPVAVLASTQTTIVLGGAATGGLLLLIGRRQGWTGEGFQPFARFWPWAVWLFLLYVAASDEWVPLYGNGLDRAWRVAVSIVLAAIAWRGALRLEEGECGRAKLALFAGIALAVALLLVERITGNALISVISGEDLAIWTPAHNRAMSVLALLLPVVVGLLLDSGRRRAALACAPVIAAVVVTGDAGAGIVALLAGFCAWGLALYRPRLCAGLLTAAFALALFVMPSLYRQDAIMTPVVERAAQASFSIQHRLLVLRFTADRIAERPWLGWGARSARDIPDGELTAADYAWTLDGSWPKLGMHPSAAMERVMPLHPHNAFFQLRLELGLAGAALFLLAAATALWSAVRRQRPAAAAALLGTVAGASALWGLGFGLWQNWLIAGLMLALVGCALLQRPA